MSIALITNAQMLERYDWRWVAKNILDGPTAATSDAPPTYAQLINLSTVAGLRLQTLIVDASDEFLAAACVGARYSINDVITYGGNLVVSIVAGLAIGPVLERRARAAEDVEALMPSYERARARLEDLRRGERILYAVPDVPEAGLLESASMLPRPGIDCPTISQQSYPYFGNIAQGYGPGGCNRGCM